MPCPTIKFNNFSKSSKNSPFILQFNNHPSFIHALLSFLFYAKISKLHSYLGAYTINFLTNTIINKKVIFMISYQPFWNTIQERGITTYTLISQYKVSRSLIDKLKHNKGLSTSTLNDLCRILHCELSDIAEYIEDN